MKHLRLFLPFVACLALGISTPIHAQFGSVDPTFNPADSIAGFDGTIDLLEALPDGKILVAGRFARYNNTLSIHHVARLNPDGSLDNTFRVKGGFSGALPHQLPDWELWDMAIQKDGKTIIVGNFNAFNGIPRQGIVRLLPNGSLDESFAPVLGTPTSVIVQENQSIILSGGFENRTMLRLLPDGTLDASFQVPDYSIPNAWVPQGVSKVLLQKDGKLLAIGTFAPSNGERDGQRKGEGPGIIRLHANGAYDSTFSVGGASYEYIIDAKIGMDGKIVVLGDFNTGYDPSRPYVASIVRLHPNGSKDLSFAPDSSMFVLTNSIDVQEDGKIVLATKGYIKGSTYTSHAFRLNMDGSVDTSIVCDQFEVNINVLNNDEFLVSTPISQHVHSDVMHLRKGSFTKGIDNQFLGSKGLGEAVDDICVQPDGKLILGGSFSQVNGKNLIKIARLQADGSIDESFKTNHLIDTVEPGYVEQKISNVELQPNGKIVVAGFIAKINGKDKGSIARLHPNGAFDSTFHMPIIDRKPPSTDYTVITDLKVLPDGKMLVAGLFERFDQIPVRGIVRLHPDGKLDTSFDASRLLPASVSFIHILKDQKILICESGSNALQRLYPDGRVDSSFRLGKYVGRFVTTVAEQLDGKILVAGYDEPYLFRFHPDGKIDNSFDVGLGFNSSINSLLPLKDKKIIVGGHFGDFDGARRNKIAFLNPDGSRDSSFDKSEGAILGSYNTFVNNFHLQPDGKIIVSGLFSFFDGHVRHNIVRLNGYEDPNGLLDEFVFGKSVESGFSAYPNPTKGTMKLQLTDATYNGARLILRDTFGQKMLEMERVNEQTEINLGALPKGIYLLELSTDKLVKSTKVVVE